MLIDNGSAVNVIFLDTLRKIDFDLQRIELAKTKLTGFGGDTKVSEGIITLPITAGDSSSHITIMDEF